MPARARQTATDPVVEPETLRHAEETPETPEPPARDSLADLAARVARLEFILT
jgi:hypothetical protein